MFYRNPLFSGVRLPEATCTLTLEHRAPTLTHTALDLAQHCLQMDPERRTQCSDLLQHQLFTHDCFHTRFLEELSAKLQQDQKEETSSLPAITTATATPSPKRDTEEGEEKSGRGGGGGGGGSGETEEKNGMKTIKEGAADERVVKKKDTKQSLSKPSKASRQSLSEPTAKRSKAPDAKATESTAGRGKAGKSNTPETRDVSRTTKTPASTPRHSDSTVTSRTSPEKSTTVYKGKLGRATNLEMKREHLKNASEKTETDVSLSKTPDVVHSTDSKSMMVKLKPLVPSHSEARREPSEGKLFTETNSTAKALKTLSSIQTDRTSTTETPLEVPTEPLPAASPETKSLKLDVKDHLNPSSASDCLRNSTSQHLDIGLISKTSRAPTNDNIMISDSSANGGKASTTTRSELAKTTDILTADKTTSVLCRTFTNSSHNDPACTETTKASADAVPVASVSDGDLTGNTFMNISKVHRDQSKLSGVTADQTNPESPTRFSNSDPCKATSKPDVELARDECTSEPVKDATSPTEHADSRASVTGSTVTPVDDARVFETRDVMKPRDVSSDDAGMDAGLPPGPWGINERTRHDSKMAPGGSDVTETATVRMKHLTVGDKNDNADLRNFDDAENRDKVGGGREGEAKDDIDHTLPPPSPPIPPPPSSTPFLFPSSAPLLPPPPTTTPLMPHRSLTIHSNSLSLGVGLQPGTHSLRCMDKPRRHPAMYNRLTNHPTGTLTAQVLSEKMVIRERSFLCERGNHSNHGSVAMAKRRADVRFPDLRSSLPLPELRAGDGKQIQRGSTKEQRKDKRQIPSIPPP